MSKKRNAQGRRRRKRERQRKARDLKRKQLRIDGEMPDEAPVSELGETSPGLESRRWFLARQRS